MTNEERLEEIKKDREWKNFIHRLASYIPNNEEQLEIIKSSDFKWLIEQAERFEKMKQEYSNDIDFKRREVLGLNERVWELKSELDLIQAIRDGQGLMIKKLHDENKRYRDALEFYADDLTYTDRQHTSTGQLVGTGYVNVMSDNGDKARKALEETK